MFSAVRLTELTMSSSAAPLGKKIPSMSLKPKGGRLPWHISLRMSWRMVAPSEPARVRDTIWPWSTVFDFLKEGLDVLNTGGLSASPVDRGGEVFGEGFGSGGVYGIFLKGVAPVPSNLGGFLVGSVGSGAVQSDDRDVDGFPLEW